MTGSVFILNYEFIFDLLNHFKDFGGRSSRQHFILTDHSHLIQ